MYMLVHRSETKEGAYAVFNKKREKVLFLFEEEDDAERYVMMLETQNNYDEIEAVEIDPDLAIKTCIVKGVNYAIITKNDFVVPPVIWYDSF